MSELPGDKSALPHAPILSYLTQTKTLSRARRVTAVATSILGLLGTAIGAWILVSNALTVYGLAKHFAAGAPISRIDIGDAIDDLREQWQFAFPVGIRVFGTLEARITYVVLFGFPGMSLLLLVPLVWRGRAWACRMACVMVVPLMIVAVTATAGAVGWGLMFGLRPVEFNALVWLLTMPLGLFLVLLMKDLCAYLLWIARNPLTEKPGVHFVSGKAKAAKSLKT